MLTLQSALDVKIYLKKKEDTVETNKRKEQSESEAAKAELF